MNYGDKGEDVVELQRSLMERGYKLPKYKADGHLGDETWSALEQYSKAELGVWDPEVPGGVVESLQDPINPITPLPDPPDPGSKVPVLDLRSEQTDPAPRARWSTVALSCERRTPSLALPCIRRPAPTA
jgi:peptidoglycan hydrolase-like protein with peptidoglycan-binding domain